ncbi:MAG TPA: metallopeptidase TldD-related protein [Burkholderiaceae bacterium]|jgi:predicted Zn-dependent protease|nr:metallopeptidase TldD-related protein [Burkholderiaceae bacterium]
MKQRFLDLADDAIGQLRGSETLLLNFAGETSDFVRFNHARVRQAGSVGQAFLRLTLIDRGRRLHTTLAVAFDQQSDHAAIRSAIQTMRTELPSLPADPLLLYATQVNSSNLERRGQLPEAEEAVDCVIAAAAGADLVGIFASGPVFRGFANSLGQRNWHRVDSFQLDWSVYLAGDKAVKANVASESWNARDVAGRIESARDQLRFLAAPARAIEPGQYRAFLTPAAMDELIGMLSWDGVSARAQRTRQSPLQKLVEGEAALSAMITLRENTADGLAPSFDDSGFARPAQVPLITGGRYCGALVSARTAKEYDLPANGACEEESMQSADLDGGTLPVNEALAALDRGILVANLWYLNFSDRSSCRITGMTRFATFWVEGGRIAAPLNVMRFDDSLYRMLGSELQALTRERDWIQSRSTYGQRSVESSRLPGALLSSLTLTL